MKTKGKGYHANLYLDLSRTRDQHAKRVIEENRGRYHSLNEFLISAICFYDSSKLSYADAHRKTAGVGSSSGLEESGGDWKGIISLDEAEREELSELIAKKVTDKLAAADIERFPDLTVISKPEPETAEPAIEIMDDSVLGQPQGAKDDIPGEDIRLDDSAMDFLDNLM